MIWFIAAGEMDTSVAMVYSAFSDGVATIEYSMCVALVSKAIVNGNCESILRYR